LVRKGTDTDTCIYKFIDGVELAADVRPAAGQFHRPVVMHIHGGALINGSRLGIPAELRELCDRENYVLVSIDYRLAPEVKLPEILYDVAEAWRWVHRQGPAGFRAHPARVAVMGESAGGFLSLMTGFAVTPRPTAIISYYGYGDLDGAWAVEPDEFYRTSLPPIDLDEVGRSVHKGVLSGTTFGEPLARQRGLYYRGLRQQGTWSEAVTGLTGAEALRPYCPVHNVTSEFPPTMLVHGTVDTDVPYSKSVDMAAALERCGVPHQLITLEGGDHGFGGADEGAIAAARNRAMAFIKEYLG
jgi:acetyl esterase/lipase